MKNLMLMVATLLLAGCSSTQLVDRSAQWLPGATKDLAGRDVTVQTRSGVESEGTVVLLTERTIGLRNRATRQSAEFNLDSVLLIRKPSGGVMPVAGGVVLGGVVGMGIGMGIGGSGDHEKNDFFGFQKSGETAAGGGIGLSIGSIIGGLAAGIMTSGTEYVLPGVPTKMTGSGTEGAPDDTTKSGVR